MAIAVWNRCPVTGTGSISPGVRILVDFLINVTEGSGKSEQLRVLAASLAADRGGRLLLEHGRADTVFFGFGRHITLDQVRSELKQPERRALRGK